jgi:hypothetical protein
MVAYPRPDTCPEELRKTTRNLSQNSRRPGRDLSRALPEYETRVLPLHQLARPPSAIIPHDIIISIKAEANKKKVKLSL